MDSLEPQRISKVVMHCLKKKEQKMVKNLLLPVKEKGLLTFTSQEKELAGQIEHALVENNFACKYLITDTKKIQGLAEQSYWWKHRETGLQCKCRCDYVIDDMVIDLKTTGEGGASPDKFTKTIVNFQYHMQAAHYLQGTGQNDLYLSLLKSTPI